MRSRRGMTVVEVVVGGTIGVTIMGAMFATISTIYSSESFASTTASVQQNAQEMATTVADGLRDATVCQSTDSANSPCTWTGGPIQNPTASQVTVYNRLSSGAEANVTYLVSNNTFEIQTTTGSGAGTTTTQSLYSGSSVTLSLVYYQAASGTTGATSLTPFTPTSATVSSIVGAQVTATIVTNGAGGQVTGSYTTTVKFRNSPAQSVTQD